MPIRKRSFQEIKSQRHSPDSLKSVERFPVFVILENIRSMYNVGAIFRTSDAACISELLLCGYTAKPPRKEIDKTALGATETVPWKYFPGALDAISYLKEKGVTVMALEHCDESQDLMTMECPFPVGLVVGNEVDGISEAVVAACDLACEIPMHGVKQSLNVAVAYGVAVFQLLEKIRQNNNP